MIGDGLWEGYHRGLEHVVWTDAKVIPGAFYSEMVWQWSQKYPGIKPRPVLTKAQIEEAKKRPGGQGVPPHAHPFQELLSFYGTDPKHPEDLRGEVEFWLEDEMFTLTKSFMVYIPENVEHCPLVFRRMDAPMFHMTLGSADKYV